MEALGASRAGAIHVFLDVGFSGRGQDGAMIAPGLQPLVSVSTAGFMDPRLVVLTAAKGDQFAGPLPGTNRPAFSYLALGGLRGWAAEDKHGKVTAGSLWHYTTIVLERTLLGRSQTPDLIGKEGTVLAASASEKGPDLAKLAEGKAGIEWVTMPGGSFMMGADDAGPCAQPRHKVTVKTFQMAKTLVMNKQYRACVEAGVCTPAESYGDNFSGDDQPVVGVNWDQAQAFVKWVGGRLPTEAEWEYAARSGGKKQNYPWGDKEATCERAVIDNGCGRNSTWPVCAKPAGNTKQGLCDMAGNVWEWVQDVYHGSYEGAPADGSAWENSAGSGRVERGGAWYSGVATYARSAYRSLSDPDDRSDYIGFRPARSR
jgi:formylglycine-generating enzyme required for sulfatase activity